MGAKPGVPHAPAGTGSVGKVRDARTGKWIWRGRVTVDGRRYYGRSVVQQPRMTDATCLRMARIALDATIAAIKRNQVVAAAKTRARLEAILAAWLEEQKARLPAETTTLGNYERTLRLHVAPILGRLRITAVSTPVLLDWRRELGRTGRSGVVVGQANTLLRRILTWARANGYPVAEEVLALKAPRQSLQEERPYLTEAQAIRLCEHAPQPRNVIWRVGYYGGLRAAEISGLKWNHVLLTSGALDVRAQRDRQGRDRLPKSGSAGQVYLPEQVLEALREHRRWAEVQGSPVGLEDYVFLRQDQKGRPAPYAYHSLLRALKEDLAAAGLPVEMGLHALRHGLGMTTAAVATALATRDQLRHRLLSTTDVYTGHRDAEGQKRAARRVGEGGIAPPLR